jgi:hypothetical protein
MIIDSSYTKMKAPAPTVSRTKAKLDPTIDKKALKRKELTTNYNIIRAITQSVAVQVRLNYVIPPVVE